MNTLYTSWFSCKISLHTHTNEHMALIYVMTIDQVHILTRHSLHHEVGVFCLSPRHFVKLSVGEYVVDQ